MAKQQEIKLEVEFTEGFEERFTRACLDVISRREKHETKDSSTYNRDIRDHDRNCSVPAAG